MWRSNRSSVVVAGAGLLLAVACQLGRDAPVLDDSQRQFGDGPLFIPATLQDSVSVAWYEGTLRDMREPRLYVAQTPVGMTVLRLLWVRSFDPPAAVRILETPGRCTVVVAITGMPFHRYGLPGSDSVWEDETVKETRPRPIVRRDSSAVAPEECAAVHAAAIAARLWSGPVVGTTDGLDGDDVIFEIADSAGHRIAQRWTPRAGSSPEFQAVARQFIALGNVDVRTHAFGGRWSPWADR